MRIFLQETKKILRPAPLIILVVFTALFSFVFMKPPFLELKTIPETSNYARVCADLVKQCGNTLTQDEFEMAIETLSEKYIRQLESDIATNSQFAQVGVTDYASFHQLERKIRFSYMSRDEMKAAIENGNADVYKVFDYAPYDLNEDYTLSQAERNADESGLLSTNDSAIQLRILRFNVRDAYERISINRDYFTQKYDLGIPDFAIKYIEDIYDSGAITNILPTDNADYMKQLAPMLSIMILLALCILLAPVLTRDNMSGVVGLQYSNKTGRKTLRLQLSAMLFVTVIISTVEIGITFLAFIICGWGNFLKCGLNSFTDPFVYNWFAGNYGQYILCVAGLILMIAIAFTLFLFILSKLSKNFISLLLGVIPITAIMIFLSNQLLKSPFAIIGNGHKSFYEMIPIPYVEVYICGILLLVGAAFSQITICRQKRKEVM